MGTEFRFGKMESSGDGWGRWLHNNVNALRATELYPSNGRDGAFYDLCILPRIQWGRWDSLESLQVQRRLGGPGSKARERCLESQGRRHPALQRAVSASIKEEHRSSLPAPHPGSEPALPTPGRCSWQCFPCTSWSSGSTPPGLGAGGKRLPSPHSPGPCPTLTLLGPCHLNVISVLHALRDCDVSLQGRKPSTDITQGPQSPGPPAPPRAKSYSSSFPK